MPSDSDFKQNNIDNLEEVRSDLSSYGFNRSVQNIYSLYLKVSLANENKNLLNVKPDCSSKDLAMIMNEYYESDGQKREKHQGFAGLGKREPAHVVTKLESTFDRSWKTHIPRQMDNGSPQRSKEDYADINSLKRLKV